MSNDKVINRLWNLQATVNKLVQDGRRDPEVLCDLLQKFMEQSVQFSPSKFIVEGYSYDEPRNPRSATLGLLADYSKVVLLTDWLQDQTVVNGETRRTRILDDAAHTALNADHFLDLWNNKEKIPESWKEVKGTITFDGDVLRNPNGDRCVLYLCWNGSEWRWSCRWLGLKFNVSSLSAVLAS